MPVLHPDPARVPPHLYSEQEVLRALSTLPPEAHVFVRVRLLDAETNKDRELDFLVVHPELGLVIVEVKGKGIEPKGDHWIRRLPDGREAILDETPGEQLLAQQYALLRFLQSEQMGFIPQITRVLALPALAIGNAVSLGSDLPACRILTRAKLQQPYLALRDAVSGGATWEKWRWTPEGKQHQVRSDVMARLLEILTPSLLPPPTLVELLASEGRLQDEKAQYLLDHLAQNFSRGRFQVSGGPGSGKSLLARQVTRIWAAEGRKVLVLAYNRALTYATQGMLNELISEGRVDVFTYHDLAVTLLSAVDKLPAQQDMATYFNEQLPQALNALLDTPGALPQHWDALVVDEAQDLDPAWVRPLLNLLTEPERDPLLLMEDSAQSIYREARHNLGQPWRLDLSLRQHPAIRRAACLAFPACGWEPPEEGPTEGALSFYRSSQESWKRDLAGQLETLATDGIEPHQVMILAPHRPESLGLKDGQVLGPWRLNTIRDWWQDEKAEQVRFGTVHAFKGLEADVVIYLAPAYKHPEGPRLTYTAYSRARHRLIVLEHAIAKPAKVQAIEPGLKKKPSALIAPQFGTISDAQMKSLMAALTAAKKWSPR
jgi:hypothetical protein